MLQYLFFLCMVCLTIFTCKPKQKLQFNYDNYKVKDSNLKPFEQDFRNAFNFLQNIINENDIEFGDLTEPEKREVISIVFPEVIRYNEFSDIIEILADRQLYIRGGSKVVDFSLGIFQMKPSFLEAMEKKVIELKIEEFEYILLDDNDEKENRKIRIDRLENISWQLKYAICYYQIMKKIYPNYMLASSYQRIEFFSTAYNSGFYKFENDLLKNQNQKFFPFGNSRTTENQAYHAFSKEFFNSNFNL